eukprot:COSAG02_NODE_2463_length_8788_cov_3.119001_9_plen_118_part_00
MCVCVCVRVCVRACVRASVYYYGVSGTARRGVCVSRCHCALATGSRLVVAGRALWSLTRSGPEDLAPIRLAVTGTRPLATRPRLSTAVCRVCTGQAPVSIEVYGSTGTRTVGARILL